MSAEPVVFGRQDYFILSEMEADEASGKDPELGWQASQRLSALRSSASGRLASARITTDSQMEQSLLNESMQSPAGRRRSSARAVKRDSLATAGSLGPIHRRTSSIDTLPSMSLPASFSGQLPGRLPDSFTGPPSFRSESGHIPRAPVPGGQPHGGREGSAGGAAGGSVQQSSSQRPGGSTPANVEMASLRKSDGSSDQT